MTHAEANAEYEKYTGIDPRAGEKRNSSPTQASYYAPRDNTPLWAVVLLLLGAGLLVLLFLLFYRPTPQAVPVRTQEQVVNVDVETTVIVVCGTCGKENCSKKGHKAGTVKKTVTTTKKSSGGSSHDKPKPKPKPKPAPTPCPPINGPGTTPFKDSPGSQPPDAGGNAGPTPGAGPGTNQGDPGSRTGSTVNEGDPGGF